MDIVYCSPLAIGMKTMDISTSTGHRSSTAISQSPRDSSCGSFPAWKFIGKIRSEKKLRL